MSRIKAIVCSVLLSIVIFGALFALISIDEIGFAIFHCITAWIAGGWLADKVEDFYKWLRKDA